MLLSFALGVFTALLGVLAKYLMDYQISKRRLEMEWRSSGDYGRTREWAWLTSSK